jgi:hypothetical protein
MRPALTMLLAVAAGAVGAWGEAASLEVKGVMVAEGESAKFHLTLSGPFQGSVMVRWVTEDLTTEVGTDYEYGSGAMEFSGPGTRTITVHTTGDAAPEGSEVFYVRVSATHDGDLTIPGVVGHGVIRDAADATNEHVKCDLDNDGRSNLMVHYVNAHPHLEDPNRHEPRHEDWGGAGTLAEYTGLVVPFQHAAHDWTLLAMDDFDGNSRCDMFWARANQSQVAFTLTQGLAPPSAPGVGVGQAGPGMGSRLVGSGRFDADGRADLLWWDASGEQLQVWLMNGPGTFVVHTLDVTISDHLVEPLAVVNLTGDRHPGILWRTTAGDLAYWEMTGLSVVRSHHVESGATGIVDPHWTLAAVGDFNGDGTEDLVWQGPGNRRYVAIWFMREIRRLAESLMSPERFLILDGLGNYEAGRIRGPR